jgi:hypothetical protein
VANNRAIGRVLWIYTTIGLVYIRLDVPSALQPKDGYFALKQTHTNYNALYSLALVAAVNGYDLQIRTEADITPTAYADVRYMVVDWQVT